MYPFFLIFAKLQNVSSYTFYRFEFTCSHRWSLLSQKLILFFLNSFFPPISAYWESRISMAFLIDNRYRREEARNWDSCRRFSRNERKSVFWSWFAFTAVRSSRKYAYEENTKRKFHLLAAETRVHFHGHFRNKYSSHLSPSRELSCRFRYLRLYYSSIIYRLSINFFTRTLLYANFRTEIAQLVDFETDVSISEIMRCISVFFFKFAARYSWKYYNR